MEEHREAWGGGNKTQDMSVAMFVAISRIHVVDGSPGSTIFHSW